VMRRRMTGLVSGHMVVREVAVAAERVVEVEKEVAVEVRAAALAEVGVGAGAKVSAEVAVVVAAKVLVAAGATVVAGASLPAGPAVQVEAGAEVPATAAEARAQVIKAAAVRQRKIRVKRMRRKFLVQPAVQRTVTEADDGAVLTALSFFLFYNLTKIMTGKGSRGSSHFYCLRLVI